MREPAIPVVNPHHFSSQQSTSRRPFDFGLRALWRRCAGDKGTSLIEFTVSIPVLFMLLLGFVQMCGAVYSSFCINEIARDTARWAAVRGSNSCADAPGLAGCDATSASIQSFAKNVEYPGIDPSKTSVSTSWLAASADTPVTWSTCNSTTSAICNAPGNAVQVKVSYPFPFQIPFAGKNTFNFSSTAQIVIVQ